MRTCCLDPIVSVLLVTKKKQTKACIHAHKHSDKVACGWVMEQSASTLEHIHIFIILCSTNYLLSHVHPYYQCSCSNFPFHIQNKTQLYAISAGSGKKECVKMN